MQRTLVIGDIHGCRRTLARLLDRLGPDPARDTLVFLGDYIDRGPDTKGVVDEILRLQREFPTVITLMGNHEQMLLAFLEGREQEFYLEMGGELTMASYGVSPARFAVDPALMIPAAHLRFFNNLLPYWEDKQFIYVHAGLRPGVHLSQQSSDWLLWGRDKFINSSYDFGKRVIFGHTPFEIPLLEPNKIGIDTGAVYGGSLTCLVLPDLDLVSVPGPVPAARDRGKFF